MNKYGVRYARLRGTPFLPVPMPPAPYKGDIGKAANKAKLAVKSPPLLEKDLLTMRSKLTDKQYNWMYVAWSFGLRPQETDQLLGPRRCEEGVLWDIIKDKGDTILKVYQPKLKDKIDEWKDRIKHVVAFTAHQKKALSIIHAQAMERPSQRRIHVITGGAYSLYGCRHGFTKYMEEEMGQDIQIVSKWLGHRNLVTTQRHYQDHTIIARPMPIPRKKKVA
jgi:integrase